MVILSNEDAYCEEPAFGLPPKCSGAILLAREHQMESLLNNEGSTSPFYDGDYRIYILFRMVGLLNRLVRVDTMLGVPNPNLSESQYELDKRRRDTCLTLLGQSNDTHLFWGWMSDSHTPCLDLDARASLPVVQAAYQTYLKNIKTWISVRDPAGW